MGINKTSNIQSQLKEARHHSSFLSVLSTTFVPSLSLHSISSLSLLPLLFSLSAHSDSCPITFSKNLPAQWTLMSGCVRPGYTLAGESGPIFMASLAGPGLHRIGNVIIWDNICCKDSNGAMPSAHSHRQKAHICRSPSARCVRYHGKDFSRESWIARLSCCPAVTSADDFYPAVLRVRETRVPLVSYRQI